MDFDTNQQVMISDYCQNSREINSQPPRVQTVAFSSDKLPLGQNISLLHFMISPYVYREYSVRDELIYSTCDI